MSEVLRFSPSGICPHGCDEGDCPVCDEGGEVVVVSQAVVDMLSAHARSGTVGGPRIRLEDGRYQLLLSGDVVRALRTLNPNDLEAAIRQVLTTGVGRA